MSEITFYNMCLGISGFIEYSKFILENYNFVKHVNVFHTNTSSLEAHFSLMRFYKADTPQGYSGTTHFVDKEQAMKIFVGNKMYETNEETQIMDKKH